MSRDHHEVPTMAEMFFPEVTRLGGPTQTFFSNFCSFRAFAPSCRPHSNSTPA